MAMGATRGRVLGLVLREGMTRAGAGIVLGLIAAFGAASAMATLLFDVPARDPMTFATVAAAVALVAVIASVYPPHAPSASI